MAQISSTLVNISPFLWYNSVLYYLWNNNELIKFLFTKKLRVCIQEKRQSDNAKENQLCADKLSVKRLYKILGQSIDSWLLAPFQWGLVTLGTENPFKNPNWHPSTGE